MVLPCCCLALVVAVVAALFGSLLNRSLGSSIEHGIAESHILEMLELSARGSSASCNKLAEAVRLEWVQAADLPKWSRACSLIAKVLFVTEAVPISSRATEFVKVHSNPEAAIDAYVEMGDSLPGKGAVAAMAMIPVLGPTTTPLRQLYKEIRRAGFVTAAYGHDVSSDDTQMRILNVLYESRTGSVPRGGAYRVGKKVTKRLVKETVKQLVKDMPGWSGFVLGAAVDAAAQQAKSLFVEADATVRLAKEEFAPVE